MNKADLKTLISCNPCKEGMMWIYENKIESLKDAWEQCSNPHWMMWSLKKIKYPDSEEFRLFACHCARETPLSGGGTLWDLLSDKQFRDAVDVAERYAHNLATDDELFYAYKMADKAWWESEKNLDEQYINSFAFHIPYVVRPTAIMGATSIVWFTTHSLLVAEESALWQADALRTFISWDQVEAAISAYKGKV